MASSRVRAGLAFVAVVAVLSACSSSEPGGDAGTGTDAATAADAGAGDGSGQHDGGLVQEDAAAGTFGATCSGDGDCTDPVYNVCFIGGQQSFCTKACTTGADCPAPPTSGTCNTKGRCK